MKINWTELARGLVAAVRRFPLPVLACLTAYGCLLALLQNLSDPIESRVVRVLMVCALALPLWFALAIRRPRKPAPFQCLPELAGIILVLAYGWRLQALPTLFPLRWIAQFGLLLFAIYCFVACAPFLRGGDGGAFWNYNKTLFLRWLLGALYSVVLFVGLALALLSLDRLLSLDIDSKNYARLFFGIVAVFHPLFFLAGAPREFSATGDYPTGLRRFVQFCLVPLVGLYLAILYVYTAKILIVWELPNGWVALPVLILAVVGILSALLLDPLRGNSPRAWAGVFLRWFYRLLLPLTLLLMISIGVRIADYGVTENRYIVALLAGWLFLAALGYGWLRLRATRWVPVSLGCLCLLTAFGPWGASAFSRRSQTARAVAVFDAYGVRQGERFVAFDRAIPEKAYLELRSSLSYLFTWQGPHQFDAEMSHFPDWQRVEASQHRYGYIRADHMLELLGLRSTGITKLTTRYIQAATPDAFTVAVAAESQLTLLHFAVDGSLTQTIATNPDLRLEWNPDGPTVLVQGAHRVTVDWWPLLAGLLHAQTNTGSPSTRFTRQAVIAGRRVSLTLTSVYFQDSGGKPTRILTANLLVLVSAEK